MPGEHAPVAHGEALARLADLPYLAYCKALIIDSGVDFEDPRLFNNLDYIQDYKTKRRQLKPVARDSVVFDESQDPSLIPAEVVISSDDDSSASIVKLGYRPTSPIEIAIDDNHRIFLRDKRSRDEINLKVALVKKLGYQGIHMPADIDPSESKLSDYIDVVGLDRISVMTFDGCWNWNSGVPCKFCDYNPRMQDQIGAKPNTNTLRDYGGDLDKWWAQQRTRYLEGLEYAFGYLVDNEDLAPHQHLLLMSGNLPNPRQVWSSAFEVIEALNRVKSIDRFDNYLNVCPHPSIEMLSEAKRLGVKQVQYNLEAIGAETFAQMCPGKMDYTQFMAKLEEAVNIMGRGNVRSNFVLGLQPVEQLLDGVEDLAKKGIVADFSIFQPKRGTSLANYPAPTMDTIIYFTKGLTAIYKQHGYHGIYCSLSSRSSIINECL